MKICGECGSKNQDKQFFCDQCGKRLPIVKMKPKVSAVQEAGKDNVRNRENTLIANGRKTFYIREDGTVKATGDNRNGQCNIMNWRDIVTVCCGSNHTVGLKKDGTVVAAGLEACNTMDWKDIVSVACGNNHTVGLKKDNTVVATGNKRDGACDTMNWRGIVSVACGDDHTVGLKKDGTFVAVGDNDYGQCNVRDWRA